MGHKGYHFKAIHPIFIDLQTIYALLCRVKCPIQQLTDLFLSPKDSAHANTHNYDCVWRRQWHPTPVLLPGKSHGQKSLVGCSPWGRQESDTTERLHFHALEKEMATHFSILAWRIPGTEEPGGLPSMGSYRVRQD